MSIAVELADNFSGPIVFDYVWWVLRQAQERKIDRLYFLARDGYTLKKAADLFCRQFGLNIDCRYLYCSRAALRRSSWFFLGNEALDLLLAWGCDVSLKTVLQRAALAKNERDEVYAECGLTAVPEDKQLSRREFSGYADALRRSGVLRRSMQEKSRTLFAEAEGYFRQEGLLDGGHVAIVDNVSTGSIQRSIRQLLEFMGYSGKITGFYFGLDGWPKSPADGEYQAWCFEPGSHPGVRAYFCGNLFECILSAPHGMTDSYKKEEGRYVPVLLPPPSAEEEKKIREQSEAICQYCGSRVTEIDFFSFPADELRRDTVRRIRRYMARPTEAEAAYYGSFRFCDDPAEPYREPLASAGQADVIRREHFLPKRIFQRITGTAPAHDVAGLFWPYGVIALMPRRQWWYRWNIYGWEWLKYAAKRRHAPCTAAPSAEDWYALADRYDVVSFDVFDTLVYRTVNVPADVFYLVGPWAKKEMGLAGFHDKRAAAEQEARRRSSREDVTLPEIYRAMGVGDEAAARLMEQEKRAELAVIRGDGLMTALLHYCAERGKRVLVITDMYHDEAFIKSVLGKAGICDGYCLYVSSAEGYTKHSGSLFRHIAEREGIPDRGAWLHIGDNEYADRFVPRRLGIQAAIYDNGRAENRRANAALTWMRQWGRWYKARRLYARHETRTKER